MSLVSKAADVRPQPSAGIPDVVSLEVDPGMRVLVASDLHLHETVTDASAWSTGELIRMLDDWQGAGVLVLAGDVIELWAGVQPTVRKALQAHPDLGRAMTQFGSQPGRRLLYLVGNHDGRVAWDDSSLTAVRELLCCEVAFAVEISVRDVAGSTVRMEHGHAYDPANAFDDPRDPHSSPLGQHIVQEFLPAFSRLSSDWLQGFDTLTDPRGFPTLIASRMFYRKVAKQARWFLLPLFVWLCLRLPFSYAFFDSRVNRIRPFSRVLLIADLMLITGIILVGAITLLLVRRWWRATSSMVTEEHGVAQNDSTRDGATALTARGYAGLVCGHTHEAELSPVADGFYANTGSGTRALDLVEARLGLPAVFLPRLQTSWVELESGEQPPWTVTLTKGRRDLPGPTAFERLVAKRPGGPMPEPVAIGQYP